MTDTPQIYEALSKVMDEVQAVAKKDRNEHSRYNFRGIDAVVNAVGPALRKHRVMVVPRVASVDYADVQTSKGKPATACRVRVAYIFYAVDGSHIETSVAGEAWDSGDKACPKAMSVAFRTALLQALALPTDEADPDSHTYERGEADVQANGRTQAPKKVDLSDIQQRAFDAVKALDEAARKQVKKWMVDNGLPVEFGQLSDEQADAVLEQCDDLASVPF